MEQKQRDLKVDTLRGIACFLLVAYHVVGGDPTAGLKINEGIVRQIVDVLVYLRMPLFVFLSGYVYAHRPIKVISGLSQKVKLDDLLFLC